MNLDEYREMKAQEATAQSSAPAEQVQAVTPETVPASSEIATEQAPQEHETPPVPDTPKPTEIEIDGQVYTQEEIKQNLMRQSDYTRKTQEVARERERLKVAEQYYQAINANPENAREIAEQFNLPYIDPKEARYKELNDQHQQLLLERDIDNLKAKHGEFDVQSLLQFAYDKRMENLDDAFVLMNAQTSQVQQAQPIDAEALKEQIRQELLNELKSTVDTSSIISTSGASPIVDKTPQLSAQEMRTAQKMRMSPEEYAKWK